MNIETKLTKKPVRQFAFAATLLLAMLASTGIAQAQTADTTPPTVNFGIIHPGVIGIGQTHAITFSEAITDPGPLPSDFSTSTGVMVEQVFRFADDRYILILRPSRATFRLIFARG